MVCGNHGVGFGIGWLEGGKCSGSSDNEAGISSGSAERASTSSGFAERAAKSMATS